MPIDMALPVFLSTEEFVYRTSPEAPAQRSGLCVDRPGDGRSSRKAKKRVTFADHRGLSLTRVKVFSQFDDPIDVPLNISQMLSSALSLAAQQQDDRLQLDFAQPSSDYLRFRQSLERNLVSLEHCVLKERALEGTVKVKNVSFEKSVKLRVTFDGWRSHRDVNCDFVKDAYPSSYSDTFSFSVALPEQLPPHQRVEFAVCYRVDGREHWDSNHGDNYRIVRSSAARSRHSDSCGFGIHFDRYGSPTCSHGIFPDWPSYAGYENSGPYY